MSTIALWRIAADTPSYTSDDLSGTGAKITGGRWNAIGTPMLYAAQTIALCCLETIVHLDGTVSLPLNRYLVRIDVPQALLQNATTLDPLMHVGWDALPSGKVSIDWGTRWCAGMTSLLARVPSVLVPEEFNVLINTNHPDLSKVKVTKIRKWNYDPRTAGRSL